MIINLMRTFRGELPLSAMRCSAGWGVAEVKGTESSPTFIISHS
jgi:hypothetical protein